MSTQPEFSRKSVRCDLCGNLATCSGPLGNLCDKHCGHAGDGEERCSPIGEEPPEFDMKTARRVANVITPSVEHLSHDERLAGTCQLLEDLERLALEDGCIAAAWAKEWIEVAANRLATASLDGQERDG